MPVFTLQNSRGLNHRAQDVCVLYFGIGIPECRARRVVGAERLVYNAADGAGAAAATSAAAETAVNLADRACPLHLDSEADILISEYVA